MPAPLEILETDRLRLRLWRETDRDVFAKMHADSEVMDDMGGPVDRATSDAKFDRYLEVYEKYGHARWLVEDHEGRFLGYTGVMVRNDPHPLGFHREIGWRFVRQAWGQGFATEASKAALHDAMTRLKLPEVVSYTSPHNTRSQSVMAKLNLERDPSRDFVIDLEDKAHWHAMVWVAPKI